MSSTTHRFGLARLAAGALSAGLIAAACAASGGSTGTSASQTPTYAGGIISPGFKKPAITMTDQNGKTFDLGGQTKGDVTVVYFGYTHCPDLCPLTMHTIAAALHELPGNLANGVKVVFITVDPRRDTPARLKSWLGKIDHDFVGLTASIPRIQKAEASFGILPKGGNYRGTAKKKVDHSAIAFLFTQDGIAHLGYPGNVSTQSWAHDLKLVAANGWQAPG